MMVDVAVHQTLSDAGREGADEVGERWGVSMAGLHRIGAMVLPFHFTSPDLASMA